MLLAIINSITYHSVCVYALVLCVHCVYYNIYFKGLKFSGDCNHYGIYLNNI